MNRNLPFILIIIFGFYLLFLPSATQAWSDNNSASESGAIRIGGAISGKDTARHQGQYASRRNFGRHDQGYGYGPYRRNRRHGHYRSPWRHGPDYGYRGHRRHGHRGYWWRGKRWMPYFYERIWNPGHYNRYGRWIPGHWVMIEGRSEY